MNPLKTNTSLYIRFPLRLSIDVGMRFWIAHFEHFWRSSVLYVCEHVIMCQNWISTGPMLAVSGRCWPARGQSRRLHRAVVATQWQNSKPILMKRRLNIRHLPRGGWQRDTILFYRPVPVLFMMVNIQVVKKLLPCRMSLLIYSAVDH